MADFIQAVKWMKDSLKVQRPEWNEEYLHYDWLGGYLDEVDNEYSFSSADYLADDWGIYKKKPSLKKQLEELQNKVKQYKTANLSNRISDEGLFIIKAIDKLNIEELE